MNASKRVILNTVILYLKTGITVVVSIFFSRYLLEALGIEDYGIYNLVGGIIGMMGFITATLSNSGTRFIARSLGENNIEKTRTVFFSVLNVTKKIVWILVVGLELTGIIFINYILKIPPERIFAANIVYQFMIVNSVYNVLTAPYAGLLFSREKIAFISILEIVDVILKLLITISLLYISSDNLIIYAGLLMILSFMNRTILKEYCIRTDELKFKNINHKNYIDKQATTNLLSFSGWSLLDSIGIITTRQGTIFLVNIFFGITVNAALGLATVVNNQLSNMSSSLLRAFQPQIYKSYGEGNFQKQSFFTYLTSKLGILLLSIALIPLIVEIDYILNIWLVEVPEFTSIFIRLSLILTIFGHISYGLTISMLANGRIKELQITTFILQVTNFPVSFLLFKFGYPVYTIYLVAISIEILSLGFRLYYAHKFINLNVFKYVSEVVIKPVFMIIISLSLNYLLHSNLATSFTRLILIVLLNTLIVIFISYLFILNNSEKKIITNLFDSIKLKFAKKTNA